MGVQINHIRDFMAVDCYSDSLQLLITEYQFRACAFGESRQVIIDQVLIVGKLLLLDVNQVLLQDYGLVGHVHHMESLLDSSHSCELDFSYGHRRGQWRQHLLYHLSA